MIRKIEIGKIGIGKIKIRKIQLLSLPILCVLVLSAFAISEAQTTTSTTASTSVPRLVRFSGTARDLNGNPLNGVVGITFLLYAEQTGGSPLWLETQNVQADTSGHYSALLGSTNPDGLPAEMFNSEQARWIAVQISGQAEQPRALLVSAPYALKAGDAETLGGLPASAFMLANSNTTAASKSSAADSVKANTNSTPTNPDVTGIGTLDYIPMWDSASDIVDSLIFQKSSEIGIATTAPAATLDVNGTADVRNTLTLFPKSTANTLAVSGTTFKVSDTGLVTFIADQTFPGAGTITGITTATGSGLSGGGTKGTLILKIPAAGVTTAMLADPKVTLNASTAGGLTTPGAMTLGDTYTIGLKTCAAKQVLQYSGTTWACAAAGTGTITGVTTASGSGLIGGGTTGTLNMSIPAAGVSNTMLANSSLTVTPGSGLTGGGKIALGGTATLGLKTCSANQVLEYVGGAWTCSNAGSGTVTSVSAGTGLTGGPITSSGTISINTSVVPQLNTANTFVGNQSVTGNLSGTGELAAGGAPGGNVASGTIEVDAGKLNTGSYSPGLLFGGGGEGMASNRTSTGVNQYGLNFFTNYAARMSVTNSGLVGIGTQTPGSVNQLEVDTALEAGVAAYSTNANANAVLGLASSSSGAAWGVQGTTYSGASNAYGVMGSATASSGDPVGVFGYAANVNGIGIFGQSVTESATGLDIASGGAGVWGDGGNSETGVIGTVDDGIAGYFGNNSPSGFPTLFAVAGSLDSFSFFAASDAPGGGSCEVYSNGNFSCTGTIGNVVPTDGGNRKVALAAIQSPMNWFEDAGSGELTNGAAVITLDADFVQTANTEVDYKVFPVPNGDCKGLYIANKTANSFEVREVGGGKSSIKFDYRIMALRRNYENIRFADHTNDPDPMKMLAKRKNNQAKPQSHDPKRNFMPTPAKAMVTAQTAAVR